MNERQRNWDPEVKKFFVKILNSVSLGLLWIMASATAGIYFELGYTKGKPIINAVLFYTAMVVTLFLLVRYLVKLWSKD
jgi:hypothetical protein